MASNVTSTTSMGTGAATSPLQGVPGLSSLSGALQGGISSLGSTATDTLNKFFPPERRAALQEKLTKFASEKPMLASFLLSQVALSGLPILLFATFTVGVAIFALLAALIVALLGAVLFIVFMAGVALIVLLPTLFITTFSATFIWLWGVGLYYTVKWFNEKPVPGIHSSLKDGLMNSMGVNEVQNAVNNPLGDKKLPRADEQDPSGRPGYQKKEEGGDSEKPHQNQNSHQNQNHTAGGDNKSTHSSSTNGSNKPKPRPLSEKKDGANVQSTKQNSNNRSQSPATKLKSTGDGVTKGVTKGVGGGLGGLAGQGVAA